VLKAITAVIFIVFVVLCCVSSIQSGSNVLYQPSKAESLSEIQNSPIYSTFDNPYGFSYGKWTAKWWEWAYSIPLKINPAYDNPGKLCSINQTSPVWFLPGTYGHDVVRKCTIFNNTSILFPILNSECSYADFPYLKNETQLSVCAKAEQDKVNSLEASIDRIKLANLNQYRIQSSLFNFTLPEDNILHLKPQTTQAVSDGNWIFLRPLSIGNHTISFRGDTADSSGNNTDSFAVPSGWNYNTTYFLSIK
jgi:hypothetical protein